MIPRFVHKQYKISRHEARGGDSRSADTQDQRRLKTREIMREARDQHYTSAFKGSVAVSGLVELQGNSCTNLSQFPSSQDETWKRWPSDAGRDTLHWTGSWELATSIGVCMARQMLPWLSSHGMRWDRMGWDGIGCGGDGGGSGGGGDGDGDGDGDGVSGKPTRDNATRKGRGSQQRGTLPAAAAGSIKDMVDAGKREKDRGVLKKAKKEGRKNGERSQECKRAKLPTGSICLPKISDKRLRTGNPKRPECPDHPDRHHLTKIPRHLFPTVRGAYQKWLARLEPGTMPVDDRKSERVAEGTRTPKRRGKKLKNAVAAGKRQKITKPKDKAKAKAKARSTNTPSPVHRARGRQERRRMRSLQESIDHAYEDYTELLGIVRARGLAKDHHPLPDPESFHRPKSGPWRQKYLDRVTEAVGFLREAVKSQEERKGEGESDWTEFVGAHRQSWGKKTRMNTLVLPSPHIIFCHAMESLQCRPSPDFHAGQMSGNPASPASDPRFLVALLYAGLVLLVFRV
ncbi:uncharacterized protein MYCFIDRAFT_180748 [Pseudocercospora fijiensis CIRAD86]|uniref:Uncharacterized protein n=1 Tax=Pseudocercospora fijiensis (strain CIRAD86) TaxID=383855 RepID=M3AGZ9_PSEFD|nr:uncharacterized protein MYCFIDRAFT_180748 [Pseudocercospora fijiensis CIRAD86]EME76762.1 hypothetical protein MYCFIDRAFT_180748 [Pseudocercospora fijiensis CIRAD86]